WDIDPQHDVRNAAGQLADADLGPSRDPPRFAKIVECGLGVDFTHGDWRRARVLLGCHGLGRAFNRATKAACSGLSRPRWRAACTAGKSPRTSAAGSSQSPGKNLLRYRPVLSS